MTLHNLTVVNRIPYSDLDQLSEKQLKQLLQSGRALEFGHTLDDLIGGQLDAGFVLRGFYEDNFPDNNEPLTDHICSFFATRAQKP